MYSENVTSVDIVAVHTHYGTFILNYACRDALRMRAF